MFLSDRQITELATTQEMITPFNPAQLRVVTGLEVDGQPVRAISSGLSCYGYDLTLASEDIWVAKTARQARRGRTSPLVINPKRFEVQAEMTRAQVRYDEGGAFALIPPRGMVLCRSVEWLNMPEDVTGVVFEKSTLSRTFLHGLMTPAEAGWRGKYVFEFYNPWDRPYRLCVGEGIAQILFSRGEPAEIPYSKRPDPKYQNQTFSGPKL
jgi:dCTP deaminase